MAMNKDDAKFLIDQFNKLAAWRMAQNQFESSWAGPLLTLVAVGLAVMTLSWHYSEPPTWFASVITTLLIVVIAIYLIWMNRFHKQIRAEQDEDVNRLLILEEHYSRFESLPNITLAKIVDHKFQSEDLKKFLKENEPSSTDSTSNES